MDYIENTILTMMTRCTKVGRRDDWQRRPEQSSNLDWWECRRRTAKMRSIAARVIIVRRINCAIFFLLRVSSSILLTSCSCSSFLLGNGFYFEPHMQGVIYFVLLCSHDERTNENKKQEIIDSASTKNVFEHTRFPFTPWIFCWT